MQHQKKKKNPPRANGSQKVFPWPLDNEEGVKAVKMFFPLLIPRVWNDSEMEVFCYHDPGRFKNKACVFPIGKNIQFPVRSYDHCEHKHGVRKPNSSKMQCEKETGVRGKACLKRKCGFENKTCLLLGGCTVLLAAGRLPLISGTG